MHEEKISCWHKFYGSRHNGITWIHAYRHTRKTGQGISDGLTHFFFFSYIMVSILFFFLSLYIHLKCAGSPVYIERSQWRHLHRGATPLTVMKEAH